MSAYRLTRHKDGFRVEDGAQPPRVVALSEPRPDLKGSTMGWRFRPVTIMRGPHSKIWPSPEAALVGFGLMTKARARDAVRAAYAPEAADPCNACKQGTTP